MSDTVTVVMSDPATHEAVAAAPGRARRSPPAWMLPGGAVAAVLVPYLVLAARMGLYGGHMFSASDYSLMDLQVHRALRWQELLGVYDRFGWHHPGPLYLYLTSFAARVLGADHGPQALMVTAALIDGAAPAATVWVVGRLAGRWAALGAAGALAVVAVAVGHDPMSAAWTPYVVVLPCLLVCVLSLAAARGSVTWLAAAALVASFCVETDVGTLPLVAVVVGGALVVVVWRRLSGSPVGGGWPAVALAAVTGLVWLPALWQQVDGPDGNLAAITRFFLAHHTHDGLLDGAVTTGTAAATVVGVHVPNFEMNAGPGLWKIGLIAAGLGLVAGLALWAGERTAAALAALGLAGVGVAVLAGADVVGPGFSYLLAWAAAPAALGLVAVGVLVARIGSRHSVAAAGVGLIVATAVGGLLATEVLVAPASSYSDPRVGAVWRLVAARAESQPRERLGLSFTGFFSAMVVAGIADELDLRGIPFGVSRQLAFGFGPGSALPPGRWLVVADPGKPLPPGTARIGVAAGMDVGWRLSPPPGWKR
ncbi:MAG TPA: hypothetical protein VFH45_02970 [Acidimicrobiales bacterium]|nr:hypothetical protein [Acidimicrobiales bacterium]